MSFWVGSVDLFHIFSVMRLYFNSSEIAFYRY